LKRGGRRKATHSGGLNLFVLLPGGRNFPWRAVTYLLCPPSWEMEAAVETGLTTGHGRLIFECTNTAGCLIKWIFVYETTYFDFESGPGGFGGRVDGMPES
jgi:hypothetical protein